MRRAGRLRAYGACTLLLTAVLLGGEGAVAPLSAQVVRGRVREAESNRTLAGVLVTLEPVGFGADSLGPPSLNETEQARRGAGEGVPSASGRGRTTLSSESGTFEVRADGPGRYVLRAKRIGATRFVSSPFALSNGETKSIDIALERLRYELPPVAITARSPCSLKPNESARVASLWDEVRTALSASQISSRDRLFQATLTRYQRTLQPRTLRVTAEDRSSREGASEQPFTSIDADTLSRRGFAWAESDGSIVYHGPDATVLLSEAFLRDHCFGLVTGRDSTASLLGLAFEPVARRGRTDVRGTLWVDARSFELRYVAFRYDHLPVPAEDPEARGEIRFERLSSGAWVVGRWFIRMPQFGVERVAQLEQLRATVPTERYVVTSYREEGGDVRLAGSSLSTASAALEGRAMDSTGNAPLRGGVVRLSGTRYQAPLRLDGRFVLESLPQGSFTLVVEHPGYTALGIHAAEQDLSIAGVGRSQTLVNALTTAQILRALCPLDSMSDERAALRVVVDAVGSSGGSGVDRMLSPIDTTRAGGRAVEVSWNEFAGTSGSSLRSVRKTAQAPIDGRGSAVFCHLPARTSLQVDVLVNLRPTGRRGLVRLEPRTITALTVQR